MIAVGWRCQRSARGRRAGWAAWVLVAGAAAGCGEPGAGPGRAGAAETVGYEVLAAGSQPAGPVGPDARGVRIIESRGDFERAYRALAGGEPPTVDFDDAVVLALDLGRQPTSGYAIELTALVRRGDRLVARVTATEPGPGCMTAQVMTRPYQLVRVPVDDEPIDIERETVKRDCG